MFSGGPSRSAFHGREADPSPLTERKRVDVVRSPATLSGGISRRRPGCLKQVNREEQAYAQEGRRWHVPFQIEASMHV
jgi:hypothetical protein